MQIMLQIHMTAQLSKQDLFPVHNNLLQPNKYYNDTITDLLLTISYFLIVQSPEALWNGYVVDRVCLISDYELGLLSEAKTRKCEKLSSYDLKKLQFDYISEKQSQRRKRVVVLNLNACHETYAYIK